MGKVQTSEANMEDVSKCVAIKQTLESSTLCVCNPDMLDVNKLLEKNEPAFSRPTWNFVQHLADV